MDKAAGRFVQSLSQDTASLGIEETRFEERIMKARLTLGLKLADSACQQVMLSKMSKCINEAVQTKSKCLLLKCVVIFEIIFRIFLK